MTKISKINANTLFVINYYSHYYKQVERYSHLVYISNKYACDVLETSAIITSIKNSSNYIRLYIPELNLDYDHNLIDKKLENLFDCEYLEDKIIIKNIATKNSFSLFLFQTVNIKISFSNNTFKKINLSLTDYSP